METLRWILLGIAVVIIIAIYYFSRTRNKEQQPMSPLEAAYDDVPSFSSKESTQEKGARGKANNDWIDGVGPIRVLDPGETNKPQSVKAFDEEFSATNVSDAHDVLPVEIEVDLDLDLNANQQSSEEIPVESPLPTPSHVASEETTSAHLESAESIKLESIKAEIKENERIDKELEAEIDENAGLIDAGSIDVCSIDSSYKSDSTEPSQVINSDETAIDDVISVYVLASEGEALIKGDKILSASYALQLEHGEMKIFHRHSETPEQKILFSMANIMNPGWFDVENINDLETLGMSFFMQVNLVDHPSRVLDDMLICAHQMATMLGGVLCNPNRQPLDEAFTIILREKVKHLEKIKAQSV